MGQNDNELEQIKMQTRQVVEELLEVAQLEEGDIVVVGCSSSEVQNEKIGSHSSAEIGKAIFEQIYDILKKRGLYLAAQCCEHLNRALVIEKETACRYGYERVNVVPQLKAGGSFGTAAYAGMDHPVMVEEVRARAGIDIGDTLIGMHLVPVAVPVRTKTKTIGMAHVVCARTRAKFIGGERAKYDLEHR
ncbi:MAG: TIGR01440 family protein [Clostridiales bacterium]|nr:TIGR01440 family protein [Clostridiales bacterium]